MRVFHSEAVFTALHFLRNLRTCPTSQCYIAPMQERLARDIHSSLVGLFVSYEESEALLNIRIDLKRLATSVNNSFFFNSKH
jgi:hypothetical protein